MNSLVLGLLLFLICSVVGALGSEVTFSPGQVLMTGTLSSGAGLPVATGDDDEDGPEEPSEEQSGGVDTSALSSHERAVGAERRKGKGNRRRNRHRGRSTTPALHPSTSHPSSYTSPLSQSSTTRDPCTSTHLGFCIHGICKSMEDLQEPVCLCLKGFDGLRCGIQTLETGDRSGGARSEAEVVQMVLVIIAVVLSVISCTAILLMTCAHYRNHKNFMAAYLGSGAEVEKLQKPAADVMV